MSNALYQIFPPLSDQQYKMLEVDIKARGVMVPVEFDDEGNILDGHHRVEIADKLGIDYPKKIRKFQTSEQKREHAIKLNLCRRQMADHVWGVAFAKLCEDKGVRLGQGRQSPQKKTAKPAVISAPTVKAMAEQCGVSERTARNRVKSAREYETYSDSMQDDLDRGKVTAAQVRRECPEPRTAKTTIKSGTTLNELKGAWKMANPKTRAAFVAWLDAQGDL